MSLKYVSPEGPLTAKYVFVGEAPGEAEEREGRPFVGRAGKKLRGVIKSLRLKDEDVYLTNVIKVRPDDNRTPTREEVDTWQPILWAELDRLVGPCVIICLGKTAIQAVTSRATWDGIEEARKPVSMLGLDRCAIGTYHPAFVARSKPEINLEFTKDICRAVDLQQDIQDRKEWMDFMAQHDDIFG